MGKLSAVEVAERIEATRAKRADALKKLFAKPFDLEDKAQVASLKSYVDQLELKANQMHLYNATKVGLVAFLGSWFAGFILPIPYIAYYTLASSLFFAGAAAILSDFSMDDYYDQLDEAKKIYKWCFSGSTENSSEKLASVDVQRMVEIMAPLCTTDFIRVWPRESVATDQPGETTETVEQSGNMISNTLSWGYSLFSSAVSTKPSEDELAKQALLRKLKVNVETRSYDVDIYNGLKQSLKYFSTSPEFRDMLKKKLPWVQTAVDYAPTVTNAILKQ